MASRSAAIGDGLATWLNDPTRSWAATPLNVKRTYDPLMSLEEMDDLSSDLIPPPEPDPEEAETRGSEHQDYTYLLMVRRRYTLTGQIPNEWVDALIDLTEQIASQLRTVELAGMGTGVLVRIESAHVSPQWDPAMLREDRTFGSGIQIVAREYRAR